MLGGLFKKGPPSLARQLENLLACGVKLLPAATDEALLDEWSKDDFEKDPYRLLLVAIGGDLPPMSTNVWHFDTECIEDHGDYSKIANRFVELAAGNLPLTDVRDFVDVEARDAWIEFTLKGQEYRWECAVEDDWVDATVLSKFASLLNEQKSDRRFAYLDLGGQDCIIGCFTDAELQRLKKVTALGWGWLT